MDAIHREVCVTTEKLWVGQTCLTFVSKENIIFIVLDIPPPLKKKICLLPQRDTASIFHGCSLHKHLRKVNTEPKLSTPLLTRHVETWDPQQLSATDSTCTTWNINYTRLSSNSEIHKIFTTRQYPAPRTSTVINYHL